MRRRDDGGAATPTAEIIAVGAELLLGDGLDTNSAWLSGRLSALGVDVRRHTVVGDDADDLVTALERAAVEHDIVVVTGGLGPTQDDVTRFAVARTAGVVLERRDDVADAIRAFFSERGRDMPERNLVQADLPAGATVLAAVGTAAGFVLPVGRALVACLPGVPAEMRAMVDGQVLALLERRSGLRAAVTRTVRTAGAAESAVAERCAEVAARLAQAADLDLSFLASRGEVRVRVTARAPQRATAHARADEVADELVALLGSWVVGVDDQGLEHLVARSLRARGWTLAVAESITGGGLGARLVTVPGASEWFLGGVITYATPTKVQLAGVPAGLLEREGPVSEAVVTALAGGVRERLGSDVGLAVVGVAGPTAQGGRRVGTVCLGAVLPDATHVRTVVLPGHERADLQQRAASAALDFLRRRLAAAVVDA